VDSEELSLRALCSLWLKCCRACQKGISDLWLGCGFKLFSKLPSHLASGNIILSGHDFSVDHNVVCSRARIAD
jgi:hypothetical protein